MTMSQMGWQLRIVSAPLRSRAGVGEVRGRMRIPYGPCLGGLVNRRGDSRRGVQNMTGRQYRIIRKMVALVLFLLPGFLFPAALAGAGPGETEGRAAFLLNFIKVLEMPYSPFFCPHAPPL